MKVRLDQAMVTQGLISTRSQAENYIKLGFVKVNNNVAAKSGQLVNVTDDIKIVKKDRYVSRAAYKLDSVSDKLQLSFNNKVVLDVGSSTGGFTDFALQHGAKKVIAVDVGTNQLHPSLKGNERVELNEQTDIRDFQLSDDIKIDIVMVDVSFISIREVLPSIARLVSHEAQIAAMVKPQFEAGSFSKQKGVIKNERIRREILKNFEEWTKQYFVIIAKSDSSVAGSKGNTERFYLLKKLASKA